MPNKVFIGSEGYIHHVYEGDQTYEIVEQDVTCLKNVSKNLLRYC